MSGLFDEYWDQLKEGFVLGIGVPFPGLTKRPLDWVAVKVTDTDASRIVEFEVRWEGVKVMVLTAERDTKPGAPIFFGHPPPKRRSRTKTSRTTGKKAFVAPGAFTDAQEAALETAVLRILPLKPGYPVAKLREKVQKLVQVPEAQMLGHFVPFLSRLEQQKKVRYVAGEGWRKAPEAPTFALDHMVLDYLKLRGHSLQELRARRAFDQYSESQIRRSLQRLRGAGKAEYDTKRWWIAPRKEAK